MAFTQGFYHFPIAFGLIEAAAGSVFMSRIAAWDHRGSAADKVEINTFQSCSCQVVNQFVNALEERFSLAADVSQTVAVVTVERHAEYVAVCGHYGGVVTAVGPLSVLNIPYHAIDVDLQKYILGIHALNGFAELLLSGTGRPEVGVIRVVRIAVPEIPVQSRRYAGAFDELFHRSHYIVGFSPIPEPDTGIFEWIVLYPVAVPLLTVRPAAVDECRIEPAALKRLQCHGEWYAPAFRRKTGPGYRNDYIQIRSTGIISGSQVETFIPVSVVQTAGIEIACLREKSEKLERVK